MKRRKGFFSPFRKEDISNADCIRCFFEIKRIIQSQSDSYTNSFGVVPEFRAGFHYGTVTTGQIGVLKKEIFFTGDVMNTTARIQASCKNAGKDILVSDDLVALLKFHDCYEYVPIGKFELRGRQEKKRLYTVIEK